MQVTFQNRGEGWRKPGRPATAVPAEIMGALKTTYEQGVQASYPLDGWTEAEIKQLVKLLEHGAKQLGRRLVKQVHDQTIRFYLEDKP